LIVIDDTHFKICEGNNIVLIAQTENKDDLKKWENSFKTLKVVQNSLSISDFRLISVIGRGSFGKVILAQNIHTQKLYALKVIKKSKIIENSNNTNIVLGERNILCLLENPFVVRLHFTFQSQNKCFFGLEYAAGGELYYHMIKHGLIPLHDAMIYSAEIVLALSHIHDLGIVYRDLKPENILFDAKGHIKLTDFGLAKELKRSSTATFCGTNFYLAPEIILGESYSFQIDWWALGILLCEMVTGSTPFFGDNASEVMESIINDPPSFYEGTPEELIEFVLFLLEKDPKLRPESEDIKNHPFFSGFDWKKVENKEYQPSYIPDANTISHFDPEFTNDDPLDSSSDDNPSINIEGFSYRSTSFVHH